MSKSKELGLVEIRAALDDHNGDCPLPARAILLNPSDHDRIGCAELWGLPVLADDRVKLKHVRFDCDGSAWEIEEELEALADDRVETS